MGPRRIVAVPVGPMGCERILFSEKKRLCGAPCGFWLDDMFDMFSWDRGVVHRECAGLPSGRYVAPSELSSSSHQRRGSCRRRQVLVEWVLPCLFSGNLPMVRDERAVFRPCCWS